MHDLRRVEEAVKSAEEQSFGMTASTLEFEKLLAHLCDQLCFFTQARQETIHLYPSPILFHKPYVGLF